jgi:hypothetical protein
MATWCLSDLLWPLVKHVSRRHYRPNKVRCSVTPHPQYRQHGARNEADDGRDVEKTPGHGVILPELMSPSLPIQLCTQTGTCT